MFWQPQAAGDKLRDRDSRLRHCRSVPGPSEHGISKSRCGNFCLPPMGTYFRAPYCPFLAKFLIDKRSLENHVLENMFYNLTLAQHWVEN